ncbi:helix-turn-helix domain-containing protein [Gryllotalpicola reticulitermitis]|uniref:Helix-turn-helix domain-containing protein n=1 Tax=Gryllotalpicola reticulitermitis TaxID=1184153 RepID=A0ABV8QAN4_9MICO
MADPIGAPDLQTVGEFATALRQLREANGNPTLEALSRKAGVSKTVLSEAFVGKKLPSERTVVAIAHAFGADGKDLAARRRLLDLDAAPPRSPKGRGFGKLTLAVVAVAGLIVGAGIGAGATWGFDYAAAAQKAHVSKTVVTDAAKIVVKNGTDPANTACVNDAKVVASQTETHDTQLQIIYSAACHAAWSRINRYDGKATGNEISTSIYRKIAPNAKDRQSTTEPDAQSAYTTLLVRPSADTEICANGSLTLGGQTIDLETPICF